MSHTHDKKSMLSQGILIFVYLAVLTALEFGIAVTFQSTLLLVAIALVKAALVVYYYMHIYLVIAGEKGHFPAETHVVLVREVHTRIPVGTTVILLGDGEFDSPSCRRKPRVIAGTMSVARPRIFR